MYWKYCLRRIYHGVMIYIIIIFIFSALFNTTMDRTVRARIEEEVHGEMAKRGPGLKPEQITKLMAELRARKYTQYKLDQPLWNRIVWRAIDTLTLNLGQSTIIRSSGGEESVWSIIAECVPRTLMLFTTAVFIDIILGLWLGIKKAQKAGGTLDKVTSVGTMIVYGMPSWWLGMLIIMFFAYVLKLFPSGGLHSTPPPTNFIAYYLDLLYHIVLPVLTLVVLGFWGRAFLIRNITLGILQEDYIMAARARGIPERKVLYGHTMRTAAPPIATMAILSLLASVGGNIIFEGIFSWPGLGNLYWVAIEQNDIPVLMGSLAMTTALYILGLVLLDLIYGYLDPRIKVGGQP